MPHPSALLAALAASLAIHAQAEPLQLKLSAPTLNASLPSASGLAVQQGRLFVVGDDSPWLFSLDAQFAITDRVLLKDYPVGPDGRIPKAIKPDYEAMAEVGWRRQDWYVVLGSGSKATVREWAYLLSTDGHVRHERQTSDLYAQLYQAGGLSGEQTLNLEGLAFAGRHAFLLNRGNSGPNLLFRVDKDELLAYLVGERAVLNRIDVYPVRMPAIAQFEAGLSGATYWAEADSLLLTASVEATGDAYGDGAILGSFVGVLPLSELRPGRTLVPRTVPLQRQGQTLITKVESVAVLKADEERVSGVLASDNDNGTSEFFRFTLTRDD
ncbi:hypothetical protein N8I74_17170 [Chitiniphilus purpureus]|uniref:Esterase-like activity of phytase family protein n=1 Tax=Chitiniphilus purpureus TaxID=2981137 RepID=A0ABY6DMV7_9NEIS|nr:hypothetical protein [Chitiniphilus sp. CD1]UXY15023.1 hypothetical protein N8I74_17170 [Chitiniphilus sp. CD1]